MSGQRKIKNLGELYCISLDGWKIRLCYCLSNGLSPRMEAATKNGETIFVLNRELLQTINSRLPEVKGRHDRRTAGFFGLVHEATDEAFNLLDIGEGTIWRDKTPIRIFSRWEVHEMINSEAQPFQWQPMPEGRYKMLDCV